MISRNAAFDGLATMNPFVFVGAVATSNVTSPDHAIHDADEMVVS